MAKSPKKREDLNKLATRIVAEATGAEPKTPDLDAGNDPVAVASGRKDGAVRAQGMSKKKRTASAKQAAATRWANKS